MHLSTAQCVHLIFNVFDISTFAIISAFAIDVSSLIKTAYFPPFLRNIFNPGLKMFYTLTY